MLNAGKRLTIDILELLYVESLTYEEIADILNCSPKTVTQKLNALHAGGFPINLDSKAAVLETGRPRKLARVS